jgi:hypothetical protein
LFNGIKDQKFKIDQHGSMGSEIEKDKGSKVQMFRCSKNTDWSLAY